MRFETTIRDTLCVIDVTRLVTVPGSYCSDAPSDLDFYGYVDELDYRVLNINGELDFELERNLSAEDEDRILEEILSRAAAEASGEEHYD